jgi:hypothetical protein
MAFGPGFSADAEPNPSAAMEMPAQRGNTAFKINLVFELGMIDPPVVAAHTS